jgi:hypothetical protein
VHVRVSVRTMVACASDAAPAYSPSMQLLAAVPKIQPRRCLTERRAAPPRANPSFRSSTTTRSRLSLLGSRSQKKYSLLNVLSMS